MTEVLRYGVHWAPGSIAFLLQSDGAQHALPFHLECPFKVRKGPLRWTSPHKINLSHVDPAALVSAPLNDPLLQAMAPLPSRDGTIWAFHDPDGALVPVAHKLCRLSGMDPNLVSPIWYHNSAQTLDRLKISNISPFVLSHIELRNSRAVLRLTRSAQLTGRRIVLLIKDHFALPKGAQWFKTELDTNVDQLPLELIGATLLHNYMTTQELPF